MLLWMGNLRSKAYEFEFSRVNKTETIVNAEIILRKEVDRLGLAPLTSMYWYGEIPESTIRLLS